MTTLYVAAPGRVIPGGWPNDGCEIDPLSRMHRRLVAAGDLIKKSAAKPKEQRSKLTKSIVDKE